MEDIGSRCNSIVEAKAMVEFRGVQNSIRADLNNQKEWIRLKEKVKIKRVVL